MRLAVEDASGPVVVRCVEGTIRTGDLFHRLELGGEVREICLELTELRRYGRPVEFIDPPHSAQAVLRGVGEPAGVLIGFPRIVRCVVTAHRDRFGVEVDALTAEGPVPAFIDFVLLSEPGHQVMPENFPAVGEVIEAVTVNVMPSGELRLSARPSTRARHRL